MSESFAEDAVCFECEGDTLIGIVAQPVEPIGRRGVLIVVGGPQYRAGSHRQFVLLSRHLAARGIPAMRFDYRGMGDSTGDLRDFEAVAADIRAAVDCFVESVPVLKEVVLWGLCDAASAAAFYAHQDPRISGVVLLNPWVRTQAGEARALLKHYYIRRVFGGDFWRHLFSGRFDVAASLHGLLTMMGRASASGEVAREGSPEYGVRADSGSLPERMSLALERFRGTVLLFLSGNDLTAREFVEASNCSARWRRLLSQPHYTSFELAAANHTFSTRAWRDEVASRTCAWVLDT